MFRPIECSGINTFPNLFGIKSLKLLLKLCKTSQVSEQKVDERGVCQIMSRPVSKKSPSEGIKNLLINILFQIHKKIHDGSEV